ncbi:MAG: hypothetical protein ACI854_001458 [Arenicella sp.]
MSANKRLILGRAIRGMLIALALAFVFVLFRSLSGPSLTSSSSAGFSDVMIGQTALRRLGSERVWVTRLSQAQARQARALDSLVVNPRVGCESAQTLCVISAKSLRSGIDLVYVQQEPVQLPRDVVWHGGFIDPTSGAVFDFLGRAYKGVKSNDERENLDLVISGTSR